jgi:hypothetical protein
MKFASATWNRLLAEVRGHQPRAGHNCRIARGKEGTLLQSTASLARWRHPWIVTCSWDAKAATWRALVRPGFVNGIDPTLNGKPLLQCGPADGLPLPLMEHDAAPPKFFELLGARNPMEGLNIGGGSGVQFVDTSWKDTFRPPPRKLFRCDLVLSVARAALNGSVEIVDPTGTSGRVVQYSPRLDMSLLDSRGSRPVLQVVPEHRARTKADDLLDRLLGVYQDAQEDVLHLARLWFLSPADHQGGVDETWAPYPQHFVFWNLAHASRRAQTAAEPKPITLFTGLAGGIGDAINQQLLGPVNDDAARISAALNAVTPEGKFWSA